MGQARSAGTGTADPGPGQQPCMELRESWAALAAGGVAGVCVDLILFPLDTVKTRLQSPQGFRKAGGFRGIYAGVPSTAIGSFPNAAAFFITYENVKSVLPHGSSSYLSPATHMVAASLGEVIPFSLVQFPLWESLKEQGPGFIVIYKPLTASVLCPVLMVLKPAQRDLWSWKQGHVVDSWQSAVCGAFAGGFAAAVTTPLDVAKTRIMLAKAGSSNARGNVLAALGGIWRTQGLSGLFAGVVPRMAAISLGGFIFLGTYEKTRQLLL
ncbi:S-adenosylmethionine mitochondrial carrier protein isoform X4 [Serinus canaria]|uniref:S-adenosylmethionine mitochondrial carrier protein isoform X4 n=1 Tax=Serinus canaria TaxID=9135 RepID=UPI0021CCB83F|nr:S-adenosylmethionine mitochondrial carrier protein isoform X4 [Serinus canaria]